MLDSINYRTAATPGQPNSFANNAWARIVDRAKKQKWLDQAGWLFLVLTGFFVPLSITATDIFMAATAAFGVISGQFFKNSDILKKNPIVWIALWIVILVVISLIWSDAPWGNRLSALHKYSKLLYIPLLLCVCKESKWRDRTIAAFLAGVTITVILSCLKSWTGLHIGKFENPSYIFYTHIETSFLVAFASYLLALYAWKRKNFRVYCLILIGLFTYQEFFINDGRTGWAAYLILLLLFAIQMTGWRGAIIGLASVVALSSGAYLFSTKFHSYLNDSVHELQHYNQKKDQPQGSLSTRLNFNNLSWTMAKERPLLGYGAGSFASASQDFSEILGWKVSVTPHNEYFMMMVEFGCVGLFSLLLLFILQWHISFSLGEMQYFAQGLLLVFMVSSIYNAFLYLSVSGHFYVLFTSLFFAQYQYADNFQWFWQLADRRVRK